MNLFTFVNRGIKASGGGEVGLQAKKIGNAAELARNKWVNALQADACRAWMNLGGEDKHTLNGLCSTLTLAGMAHAFDHRNIDSVELRIVRGAISAAEQCGKAGGVISALEAQSFTVAANRAIEMVEKCSQQAIIHACQQLHNMVHGAA